MSSSGSQFWVYLPGYVIAVPSAIVAVQQWRRARRAEKAHKAAEKDAELDEQRRLRQQEINDMVAAALKVLTGTDNPAEIHETNAANPSIRDSLHEALEETAVLTSEVAILHRAVELHLAEPHGGTVPEWMMRAIAAQQRTQGQR